MSNARSGEIILKPCPFCGADARFVKCVEPDTQRVVCTNGGKCTASRDEVDPYGYATKAIAAEAWNTRVTPPIESESIRVCQSCNGNDYDIPCAYPSGGMPGCYRDFRLNLEAMREMAKPAPSQDRVEAVYAVLDKRIARSAANKPTLENLAVEILAALPEPVEVSDEEIDGDTMACMNCVHQLRSAGYRIVKSTKAQVEEA